MEKPDNLRQPEVRDYVIYFDEYRNQLNALITAVHGEISYLEANEYHEGGWWIPCINLVYVVSDDKKTDGYGRQTDHATSCVHASQQPERAGYYWCFPDEVGKFKPLPLNSKR